MQAIRNIQSLIYWRLNWHWNSVVKRLRRLVKYCLNYINIFLNIYWIIILPNPSTISGNFSYTSYTHTTSNASYQDDFRHTYLYFGMRLEFLLHFVLLNFWLRFFLRLYMFLCLYFPITSLQDMRISTISPSPILWSVLIIWNHKTLNLVSIIFY